MIETFVHMIETQPENFTAKTASALSNADLAYLANIASEDWAESVIDSLLKEVIKRLMLKSMERMA